MKRIAFVFCLCLQATLTGCTIGYELKFSCTDEGYLEVTVNNIDGVFKRSQNHSFIAHYEDDEPVVCGSKD